MCLVPSLPSRLRLSTLKSIADQSVPVSAICVLTQKAPVNLSFPAKISWVMNEFLGVVDLGSFDYLLRVDDDVDLPVNFVEGNLAGEFDIVGYGPAQLIKVSSFVRLMGGRFNCEHDDGYPIFKFKLCGLKAQASYFVEPNLRRLSGFHQGLQWFVSQGVLHYKYGHDILYELVIVLGKWRQYHPYGLFFLLGYFKALFSGVERFDVGEVLLYQNMRKFRCPSRFLRVFTVEKYRNRMLRLIKFG